MRKVFLFVLFISIVINAGLFAQTKWTPKGAKWYYTRPYYEAHKSTDNYGDCVVFESMGDTVVNGQHAIALDVSFCSGKNISIEIIKQSGDTLFYLNNGEFYPLYNFSAKVGDTITVHSGRFKLVKACLFYYDSTDAFQYKVTAIDSVEISGKWLRRQTVTFISQNWGFSGGYSQDNYIVEKLGSLTYFFGRASVFLTSGAAEAFTLLRCYTDSVTAYHNPKWTSDCDLVGIKEINGTGNPAIIQRQGNNTLSIHLNKKENGAKLFIYDMDGRMMTFRHLQSGDNLISLQDMKTGIYFLKIVSATGTQTYKFLKL